MNGADRLAAHSGMSVRLAAPHSIRQCPPGGGYGYTVGPGEASLAIALPCPGPEAAAALCVTGARPTLPPQGPGSARCRTLLREVATAIGADLRASVVPRHN